MDELIGRPAAKAGVNDAVAEKNIGIIPGFLCSEGFSHNVQVLVGRILLIDRIPGADAAISASAGGNGLTAFMGSLLMAAGTKLLGVGLGTHRTRKVAHELFRFGHDKIGTGGITEIAGPPGLSQLA